MTETDLRIIHSKLDSLSERLDRLEVQFNLIRQSIEKDSVRVTVYPDPSTNHFLEVGDLGKGGSIPCVFDNMLPEDRMKPMSISCQCPKCSPYCLSSGSLSDAGFPQKWI